MASPITLNEFKPNQNSMTHQICLFGVADVLVRPLSDMLGAQYSVSFNSSATEESMSAASLIVLDESGLKDISVDLLQRLQRVKPSLKWLVLCHHPDAFEWNAIGDGFNRGEAYFTIRKPVNVVALKSKIKRIAIQQESDANQGSLLAKIQEQNTVLMQQNHALTRLNASKTQFLKRFMDKMDAPAQSVKTAFRQMSNSAPLSQQQQHLVAKGFANIRKMELAIQNLVLMGELEDGNYPLSKQHFNLDALVTSVVDSAQLCVASANAELLVHKPIHLGHVYTDLDLLQHGFETVIDGLVMQARPQSELSWELKLFDTALESVWELKHHRECSKEDAVSVLTTAAFDMASAKSIIESLGGKLIYSAREDSAQVVMHLPTS